MPVQIPLDDTARAPETTHDKGIHQVAPDLAYKRTLIVNVVFYGLPDAGDHQWILIDTGVGGSAGDIAAAAEARFGRDTRPSAILLTHGHFDHIGALEDLAQDWDVPVYAHPLEHPYLDGSRSYPPPDTQAGGGLLPLLSPLLKRSPIDVSDRLLPLPADHTVPGMPGWHWIHTPGHSPGHVSLWHEQSRSLVAGDAIVTTGQESVYEVAVQEPEMHGPPRYFTPDWEAAERSVQTLAGLEPELVVTGHGRAMSGAEMRSALRELAAQFREIAVPEHLRGP